MRFEYTKENILKSQYFETFNLFCVACITVYQKIKSVSKNYGEEICPGGMYGKGYNQTIRPQHSKYVTPSI